MPETGGFLLHHHHHHHHQDQVQSSLRSGFRTTATARDASPDSVIFTLESNFSLFSSASASVDRCSFTSDALDHDSLASSDISLHLAGHEGEGGGSSDQLRRQESNGWSGPDRDSDPKKVSAAASAARSSTKKHNNSRSHPRLKAAKASAQNQSQKEDNDGTADDATAATVDDDSDQFLDSARSSFSLALKECQDRRARSEAFERKLDRRRPASLDLNNVAAAAASSPRLGTMKKASVSSSSRRSGGGNFPSPGTPNYRLGMQKGWSSERVPLHNGVNWRNANAAASLLPFNNNGRTLPSKWEDAERWIFSPISGDGPMRTSVQQAPDQRRPKSKSGPLGPPGVAYYSLYSPAAPVFDGIGGSVGNFVAGSPFSTGVIAADGLAMRSSNATHGLAFPPRAEPCMARSVSVHGCSDMVGQSSLPFQDEKHEGVKDAATDISRTVSRRDMATQMSPEGSNNSSPSRRLSFSASTPSALPIVEVQSVHSYKSEVRDVQVDERVTFTRWSKKHRNRNNGTSSGSIDSWRKKAGDAPSCPWDASEAAKSISKVKREEAKITAWENLQKAKAEAAIRKLEMKLEKKRSSSIDKIMSKLKSAQKKAQEMRNSVLANQAHQVSRTSHKVISFRRTRQMGSLSGCFTCHAF